VTCITGEWAACVSQKYALQSIRRAPRTLVAKTFSQIRSSLLRIPHSLSSSFLQTKSFYKYCHVSAAGVTYDNGFWISWLDLLALLYNYNQLLKLTINLDRWGLSLFLLLVLRPTANKKSKSKLYYDRQSAGQSVLEQSTHLGLTTRSWLLSDSWGFVGLGRSLWRENGSAVCSCDWLSPAQSFSVPSPLRLVAIFYCLRFQTSLFVASYDSQGHGGGIRPSLHTGTTANDLRFHL
jgi:hypothetical protein